ncbi:hypothetical protein GGX14DRAFT_660604 [Mycena pura]|uniref:Uncharacterized protein n=1 Tax=Mycena pura TaxID=153505 RepID=A0AAD6V1P9_9AGAR|nr:hypothetical protein GGX14DRAFT_660604 [Mycena pura]
MASMMAERQETLPLAKKLLNNKSMPCSLWEEGEKSPGPNFVNDDTDNEDMLVDSEPPPARPRPRTKRKQTAEDTYCTRAAGAATEPPGLVSTTPTEEKKDLKESRNNVNTRHACTIALPRRHAKPRPCHGEKPVPPRAPESAGGAPRLSPTGWMPVEYTSTCIARWSHGDNQIADLQIRDCVESWGEVRGWALRGRSSMWRSTYPESNRIPSTIPEAFFASGSSLGGAPAEWVHQGVSAAQDAEFRHGSGCIGSVRSRRVSVEPAIRETGASHTPRDLDALSSRLGRRPFRLAVGKATRQIGLLIR